MASAQISGLYRIYRAKPSGDKLQVMQQHVTALAPAGGASEGAAASVATPEKLLTVNSPVTFVSDDVVLVSFTADAAATIGTVTKTIWNIPTVSPSGSSALGRAQFTSPTLTAVALPASTEVILAGYKVTEGTLRIAGKIFMDLQNNA
jgi:hypothetical protein